jgi:hypothetical protein
MRPEGWVGWVWLFLMNVGLVSACVFIFLAIYYSSIAFLGLMAIDCVLLISLSFTGCWIKSRQLSRFALVEGRVLVCRVEERSYAVMDSEVVCWDVELVSSYTYSGKIYETRVLVSDSGWRSRESALAYIANRVYGDGCLLAVNPRRPAECFLFEVDPRKRGRYALASLVFTGLAVGGVTVAWRLDCFNSAFLLFRSILRMV